MIFILLLTLVINLIIMVISRKKRTSLFRQLVEKEWSEYFWEFVLKYTDKLDWDYISRNPNISMDIIEKYPDKPWVWNWSYISCNTFNYEKKIFIEKRMKEYLAAYRIQQYYLTALCDPYCRIGIRKIRRNYEQCFNEDGRIKLLSNFR